MKISELVEHAHKNAREHGFWDEPREVGTLIALVHSEVSEALEATTCADVVEELADICIRIGDMAGGLGILISFADYDIADIESDLAKTFSYEDNQFLLASIVNINLSKALEADRRGDVDGFAYNLSAALYATFGWASRRGYTLEEAIIKKMEKNKARPRLHGKAY